MSLRGALDTLEQLLGLAIVTVVLLDVFPTVLYPRLGPSTPSICWCSSGPGSWA